ncbi:MAG: leucine-rich repeat domain-containing protein [Muribaculaceae bacterium]|nr:leucine-rich repeat domain-containing protein [Muribaculaceae bacterium]
MKHFLLAAACTLAGLTQTASAENLPAGSRDKYLNGGETVMVTSDRGMPMELQTAYQLQTRANDAEPLTLSVQTTKEGELSDLLGEKLLNIGSLTVSGPINESDFNTLWRASFDGWLTDLDLKEAAFKNEAVPQNAFYHPEEQIDLTSGRIYVIRLKRLVLPENTASLGKDALGYAVELESVNIPSGLKEIGEACFYECRSLNFDVLTIPEGVEAIEPQTFFNCRSLTAQVVLPSTLKSIGKYAFMQSKITAINLPDGLQGIGDTAFYGTRLKNVIVPGSVAFTGSDHFGLCYELESLEFKGMPVSIPEGLCYSCTNLDTVNIPESVTEIGSRAFEHCSSLRFFNVFTTNLVKTGANSFNGMNSLLVMRFPKTMKVIGRESCMDWSSIERVFCDAVIPPYCDGEGENSLMTPFGRLDSDSGRDTPLYVPRGSVESYRNAWGWNYFTNIMEIDEFYEASVDELDADGSAAGGQVYDLTGRKVMEPIKGGIYVKGGKKFVQN